MNMAKVHRDAREVASLAFTLSDDDAGAAVVLLMDAALKLSFAYMANDAIILVAHLAKYLVAQAANMTEGGGHA